MVCDKNFKWYNILVGQTDTSVTSSGQELMDAIKAIFKGGLKALWDLAKACGTDGCPSMRSTGDYAGVTARDEGESLTAKLKADLNVDLLQFHCAAHILTLCLKNAIATLPKHWIPHIRAVYRKFKDDWATVNTPDFWSKLDPGNKVGSSTAKGKKRDVLLSAGKGVTDTNWGLNSLMEGILTEVVATVKKFEITVQPTQHMCGYWIEELESNLKVMFMKPDDEGLEAPAFPEIYTTWRNLMLASDKSDLVDAVDRVGYAFSTVMLSSLKK
jgi:hypothetical protein